MILASTSSTLYYQVGIIVSIGAVLLGGWRVWVGVRRRMDDVRDAVETIAGVPAKGGRPAIPGLPSVVQKHTEQLGSITTTLAEHGSQLQYLVTELSHNGGSSFRDHVERDAGTAAAEATKASELAAEAHKAANRAAAVDNALAQHFGVEVPPEEP